MNNEEKQHSRDIAFDLARESLDYQLTQADTLDNKANSLQIAAPGLVGVDLILLAVLLPLQRSTLVHALQDLLLIPLLLGCAVTMLYASNSYKIGNYQRVPKPRALKKYLEEPEDYTKEVIFETTIRAFEINEDEINRKVSALKRARLSLNIELIIFTVVLVAQIVLFQFVS